MVKELIEFSNKFSIFKTPSFRKYQTFVDQIEHLFMLRTLLRSQLNSINNDSKLAEKVRSQMEEANILKGQHDKRKKYLEQKMKKNNLDKMFSNFVNMKEMICLEGKHCNESERNVFDKLKL